MHSHVRHIAIGIVISAVLAGFVACDARTSVRGDVIDNKGKPIAGATVRLILVNTGRSAETITGPDGKFAVELIHGPFSRFELVASAWGYKDYRQQVYAKTTENVQIALIPQSVLEQMFPNAPRKAETVDCFRSLTPETPIAMIVQKSGRPDEETGSGLYIFVWNLQGGSSVAVGTGSLDRTYYAIYTESPGKSVSLLAPKR